MAEVESPAEPYLALVMGTQTVELIGTTMREGMRDGSRSGRVIVGAGGCRHG